MASLRELLATFQLKADDKQVKKADKTLGGFKEQIQKVGAAIGVFFVARGISQMVTGTIRAADEIGKLSSKLGLGAQSLQEYQFAAQKTGVPIAAINIGLQRFIRRTAEAAKGTGSALKTLQELDIQLKNTDGSLRSTEDVFDDVADAIQNTEDDQERLRIAFQLFDSEGVALVNTLKDGSAGLEEMRKEARALGGIMSDELIKQSEEATDNLLGFDSALQGIKNQIVLRLLPAISRGIKGFTGLVSGLGKSEKAAKIFKLALIALGAVAAAIAAKMLIAFAPLLLKIGLMAAGFALVVFVVQDLIAAFKGGESVLGQWANDLDDLIERAAELSPLLKDLRDVGLQIGDAAASLFQGTSAEERELAFQSQFGAAGRAGRSAGRFAAAEEEPEVPSFLTRGRPGGVQERAIPVGPTQAPQIVQNMRAELTVNASGLSEAETLKVARREGKRQMDGMLKDAAAAQPSGAGSSF